MTADPVRAFVALELGAGLHERLARLVPDLKARLPGLRVGPVANAHLTLRFLGDASPGALEHLAEAIAPDAAACPAADVPVTGLGTFPPKGAPSVLWLGLDLPAPMRALQEACERAARAAGFAPETRPFRPHVTLGRWHDRVARPGLPALEPFVTRVDRLTLFASELHPGGARHTALRTFDLGRYTLARP